ncbi:TPA: endolytic transglycosylase MltG [Candidatus Poribacteria bacterium]|nr:endolytic transglycosylase MltG [Candidatus Poribacteria bacterium]
MSTKTDKNNNFKTIILKLYRLAFNIHDSKHSQDKNYAQRSLRPVLFDFKSNISRSQKIVSLLFLYVFGILIFYACVSQLLAPVGGKEIHSEVIRINPGMNIINIGILLAEKGLVKSSLAFQAVGILNGTSHSLKAGDYAINSNMGISEILRLMVSGETVLYKFTIPEGLTLPEIAKLWEENGFGTSDRFIEKASDPNLRTKYRINANSLEGYLFPNTYMFPYGISEEEAIDVILRQFFKDAYPLIEKKSPEIKLSPYETIILASIIEKEAKVDAERPIISAVFHNRLKCDMKLESCPTVLYGLGYPNRELTYQDLRNASLPYNTYVYKGLPPGPICNPGIKSINSALNPSGDSYLYFVSKNDGTHYFAKDYTDFLIAKRKYQGS